MRSGPDLDSRQAGADVEPGRKLALFVGAIVGQLAPIEIWIVAPVARDFLEGRLS